MYMKSNPQYIKQNKYIILLYRGGFIEVSRYYYSVNAPKQKSLATSS